MHMYIRYYLDPKKVNVTVMNDGKRDIHKVGNTHIYLDAGQPVLNIENGRWKEPPADLADKVLRVTIAHVVYDYDVDRAPGLYKLGKAEGYVNRTVNQQGAGIMAEVTAPTKEDAVALWDAILRGDIRPAEEHHKPQVDRLLNDKTLMDVRHMAAGLARKILREEMARLIESA
jgi:hypothetical protein